MMDGGIGSMMNSMMGWMMAPGLLSWVLVIALLVTTVVLLVPPVRPDRTRGWPVGRFWACKSVLADWRIARPAWRAPTHRPAM